MAGGGGGVKMKDSMARQRQKAMEAGSLLVGMETSQRQSPRGGDSGPSWTGCMNIVF